MGRYYFINENLPEDMVSALSEYGCCVRLPAFPKLSEPVLRHPDMLIAEVGGCLIVHRHYIKGRKILEALGVPHLLSEEEPGLEYPRDIALNCFSAGGFFFANQKYVSRTALHAAKKAGFAPVHVKQGYAKCACVVAHGAVATADSGICAAALRCGLPALKLNPGGIGIERYDTGFLGGACGLVDRDTLGFFGNVEEYGQYAALHAFFEPLGVRLLSLGKGALFDYGGMITVEIP